MGTESDDDRIRRIVREVIRDELRDLVIHTIAETVGDTLFGPGADAFAMPAPEPVDIAAEVNWVAANKRLRMRVIPGGRDGEDHDSSATPSEGAEAAGGRGDEGGRRGGGVDDPSS